MKAGIKRPACTKYLVCHPEPLVSAGSAMSRPNCKGTKSGRSAVANANGRSHHRIGPLDDLGRNEGWRFCRTGLTRRTLHRFQGRRHHLLDGGQNHITGGYHANPR